MQRFPSRGMFVMCVSCFSNQAPPVQVRVLGVFAAITAFVGTQKQSKF